MSKMTEDLYNRLEVATKEDKAEVDFHVDIHKLVNKMVCAYRDINENQVLADKTHNEYITLTHQGVKLGQDLLVMEKELMKLIALRGGWEESEEDL